MFFRKRGKWLNLSGKNAVVSPGAKTITISTSSISISAEQASDYHSVRGTDKIAGITEKATTSLQTVQAASARIQA
jgi:hypothetical protein